MKNVYTVQQVNSYIKNIFVRDYMLQRLYVKGEVSNCKYHTSGHVYFSLKDASGAIACVLFARDRGGLSFPMQDGQKVIVLGSVSVYERDGKYQLYAKEILPDGNGRLYEQLQALKAELEEMGMFAPQYKRPIPPYAKTVGVITAPTGAAIRDIIQVARRRNPYVQILLYPALVQGEGAVESLIRGLAVLEQQKVDVIILGRGGGSIEDLWAFNDRELARAIFDCSIPVISAVGHETDTVISDYVADLRAPTPSAAAELAVYEYATVDGYMQTTYLQLKQRLLRMIQLQREQVKQQELRLSYTHPRRQLQAKGQRLADLETAMGKQMRERIANARYRLALAGQHLKGLSPMDKLSKGYAFVEGQEGRPLRHIRDTAVGESLRIFVTDGQIKAEVTEVQESKRSAGE